MLLIDAIKMCLSHLLRCAHSSTPKQRETTIMKHSLLPYFALKTSILPVLVAGLLAANASAQQLTYNLGLNPGWFATDAWGENPPTFDSNWIDGRVAGFTAGSAKTIQFEGNATVANFNLTGVSGLTTFVSAADPRELRFSDTVDFIASWGINPHTNVSVQGDFTMTGGWIRSTWTHANSAYTGTATLEGGAFQFQNVAQVDANSHFVIDGGVLRVFQNSLSVGTVELNSGDIQIGRTGSATASAGLTVTELSGTGGVVRRSDNTSSTTNVFTVNQTSNTTFAGEIRGLLAPGEAQLQFVKSGTGNLTLSGEIELVTETQLNGGGLFINGSTTSFSSDTGTTAILVNDGILGGTGTINTASNHNVVLASNGGLAGGLEGTAGLTTFALGTGVLDLSSATASANTGWLKFDLGSAAIAGVSYDQIQLSTGALDIGTDLDFNDFGFNLLVDFAPGTYTLFDTDAAIVGTLGTTTGILDGYDAELAIVGNDLVLQVIPEPASMAAVFAALVAAVALLRRRRG